MTKYPDITINFNDLIDTGPFAILALCRRAMKIAGLPYSEFQILEKQVTQGSYEDLLEVIEKWFRLEGEDEFYATLFLK